MLASIAQTAHAFNATLSLQIPQLKLAAINKTQVEANNLAFAEVFNRLTDRSFVRKGRIPKKKGRESRTFLYTRG